MAECSKMGDNFTPGGGSSAFRDNFGHKQNRPNGIYSGENKIEVTLPSVPRPDQYRMMAGKLSITRSSSVSGGCRMQDVNRVAVCFEVRKGWQSFCPLTSSVTLVTKTPLSEPQFPVYKMETAVLPL